MKWYCALHCQESNHQVCGLEPRFTFQRIRFFFIGLWWRYRATIPKSSAWRADVLANSTIAPYKLPHEQHISLFINFVLILSQMGWHVIFQSCGAWKFIWELTNQNLPIVTIPYALMFWCLVLWVSTSTFPLNGREVQRSLLRSLLTFCSLQGTHRNLQLTDGIFVFHLFSLLGWHKEILK